MSTLVNTIFNRNTQSATVFPNKKQANQFIEQLFEVLYINTEKKSQSAAVIEAEFIYLGLWFNNLLGSHKLNPAVDDNWQEFSATLPALYEAGIKDAQAIFEFDPAANSLEEVLHTYPGFYAIAIHRISHYLWQSNVKALARLFAEHVHSKTGIDIHPGAQIGHSFAIDHGTGIVIGESTQNRQ